jgi:hypothetical protein
VCVCVCVPMRECISPAENMIREREGEFGSCFLYRALSLWTEPYFILEDN